MKAQTRIFSVATTIACFALASPGFAQTYGSQSAVQVDLGVLNTLPSRGTQRGITAVSDTDSGNFQTTIVGGGENTVAPVKIVHKTPHGHHKPKPKTGTVSIGGPLLTTAELNSLQLKAHEDAATMPPGDAPAAPAPGNSEDMPAILTGRPSESDQPDGAPVTDTNAPMPYDKPSAPTAETVAPPSGREDLDEPRKQPALPGEPPTPAMGLEPEKTSEPPAQPETIVITLPPLPPHKHITTKILNEAELKRILADIGEPAPATTQSLNQNELAKIMLAEAPPVPESEMAAPVSPEPAPVTTAPAEEAAPAPTVAPQAKPARKITTAELNQEQLAKGPMVAEAPTTTEEPAPVFQEPAPVTEAPAIITSPAPVTVAPPVEEASPPPPPAPVIATKAQKAKKVTTADLNQAQLANGPTTTETPAAVPSAPVTDTAPAVEPLPLPVTIPAPPQETSVAPGPIAETPTVAAPSAPAPVIETTPPVEPAPVAAPKEKSKPVTTADLNQAQLAKGPATTETPAPAADTSPIIYHEPAPAPETPAVVAPPAPAPVVETAPVVEPAPAPAEQASAPPAPKPKAKKTKPKTVTAADLNQAQLAKGPTTTETPVVPAEAPTPPVAPEAEPASPVVEPLPLPTPVAPPPAPEALTPTELAQAYPAAPPPPVVAPAPAPETPPVAEAAPIAPPIPTIPKPADTTTNLNQDELVKAAPPPAVEEPAIAAPPAPAAPPAIAPAVEPAGAAPAPILKPNDDLAVSFAPGATVLTKEAMARLDSLVARLKQNSDLRIELRSIASAEKGSTSKARRTSLSRALEIKSYLVRQGISEDSIDVRALGAPPGQPASDRVDFFLMR